MTTLPPPQGLNEADYEAIEAAVTETVRGRWFLNEFARRNRAGELRQLLDAMSRLEGAVASGQAAVPPPADPSVRLLMQRIKEIAGQLDMLSLDMREAGVDERFASAVEKEARAVSGMMRGTTLPRPPAQVQSKAPQPVPTKPAAQMPAQVPALVPPPVPAEVPAIEVPPRAPAEPGAAASLAPPPAMSDTASVPAGDRRLAVLAGLDELPLRDKLALFA